MLNCIFRKTKLIKFENDFKLTMKKKEEKGQQTVK